MRLKFFLFVLLQVLILCGMIAYREYWVKTGEKVFLRVSPVDPRDLFRGDYVSLHYEISDLDLDQLSMKENFRPNEKIYVLLGGNEDGTSRAVGVSKTLPGGTQFIQGIAGHEQTGASRWEVSLEEDSGTVHTLTLRRLSGVRKGDRLTFCLDAKGLVLNYDKSRPPGEEPCKGNTSLMGTVVDFREIRFRQLPVEYGVESFFVQEGRGREVESAQSIKDLRAEVVLRKDGKGMLKALWVDAKAFE